MTQQQTTEFHTGDPPSTRDGREDGSSGPNLHAVASYLKETGPPTTPRVAKRGALYSSRIALLSVISIASVPFYIQLMKDFPDIATRGVTHYDLENLAIGAVLTVCSTVSGSVISFLEKLGTGQDRVEKQLGLVVGQLAAMARKMDQLDKRVAAVRSDTNSLASQGVQQSMACAAKTGRSTPAGSVVLMDLQPQNFARAATITTTSNPLSIPEVNQVSTEDGILFTPISKDQVTVPFARLQRNSSVKEARVIVYTPDKKQGRGHLESAIKSIYAFLVQAYHAQRLDADLDIFRLKLRANTAIPPGTTTVLYEGISGEDQAEILIYDRHIQPQSKTLRRYSTGTDFEAEKSRIAADWASAADISLEALQAWLGDDLDPRKTGGLMSNAALHKRLDANEAWWVTLMHHTHSGDMWAEDMDNSVRWSVT